MKTLLRKVLVVFYWFSLLFVLLVCLVGVILALGNPADARGWVTVVGAAAFAGLIGWRLWLNSRAVGWGGPMPSVRRLLLLFAPLAVVALVGLVLIVLGLGWIGYGFWLDSDAAVGPLIGGVFALAGGAALIVPLALHLRHRPARDSA